MLTFRTRGTRRCDGVTRRDVLHVGGLGVAGLSLTRLLSGQFASAAARSDVLLRPSGGKAKSCIVLFLMGGPPDRKSVV